MAAAAGNIGFNIYSFRKKNQREDEDRIRKQRLDWLKTLILDSNLTVFFDFFDHVEQELRHLTIPKSGEVEKKLAIEKINDQRIFLRRKFISLLAAVDENLYNCTLEKVDNLIDGFTANIADEGINLKHEPKFEEIIINRIIETRTEIIKEFFKFEGVNVKKLPASKKTNLLGN